MGKIMSSTKDLEFQFVNNSSDCPHSPTAYNRPYNERRGGYEIEEGHRTYLDELISSSPSNFDHQLNPLSSTSNLRSNHYHSY